jgi:hypothetical protein
LFKIFLKSGGNGGPFFQKKKDPHKALQPSLHVGLLIKAGAAASFQFKAGCEVSIPDNLYFLFKVH